MGNKLLVCCLWQAISFIRVCIMSADCCLLVIAVVAFVLLLCCHWWIPAVAGGRAWGINMRVCMFVVRL
jgi:hypothetical protein